MLTLDNLGPSVMDTPTTFRLTTLAISRERDDRASSDGFQQALESEISDEALMIQTNEMARTLAIISARH